MKDYDDAMVVRGYVVDIKEDYAPATSDATDQMLVEVTLLLSRITYVGKEDRHMQLEITNF